MRQENFEKKRKVELYGDQCFVLEHRSKSKTSHGSPNQVKDRTLLYNILIGLLKGGP